MKTHVIDEEPAPATGRQPAHEETTPAGQRWPEHKDSGGGRSLLIVGVVLAFLGLRALVGGARAVMAYQDRDSAGYNSAEQRDHRDHQLGSRGVAAPRSEPGSRDPDAARGPRVWSRRRPRSTATRSRRRSTTQRRAAARGTCSGSRSTPWSASRPRSRTARPAGASSISGPPHPFIPGPGYAQPPVRTAPVDNEID